MLSACTKSYDPPTKSYDPPTKNYYPLGKDILLIILKNVNSKSIFLLPVR